MGIFFSLMTFGLVLLVVPVMILVVSLGEPVLITGYSATVRSLPVRPGGHLPDRPLTGQSTPRYIETGSQ